MGLSISRIALGLAIGCAACSGTMTGTGGRDDQGNLPTNDDPVGTTSQKLTIDRPARGQMIASSAGPTVEVAGTIASYHHESLKIDGHDVDINEDGTFSVAIQAQVGVNIIDARLEGAPGARAQRAFLYGEFAPADAFVASAIGLRVNQEGMDDNDPEVDDLAALLEASLADQNLMEKVPAHYSIDAPVVGNVDVDLSERSAGRPQIDLTPRDGGMHASVTLPNVKIKHKVSFSCLITTCHATGTATADRIVVTVEVDLSLDGDAIKASTHDAHLDIVNFQNDEDGSLASAAQSVVEYFIPNLEQRIEDLLQPAVANAAKANLSVALSQLALPATIVLPGVGATLDVTQKFDRVEFAADGGLVAAAVRVSATFAPDAPGADTPGWLRQAEALGTLRTEPAFAIATSLDLINQLLYATWGQGALNTTLPAGTFEVPGRQTGDIHVTLLAPPVLTPGAAGQVHVVAGDVMVDTTLDGVPTQIAVSISADAELSVDPAANVARIELVGQPVLYAEMITGPDDLPGTLFSSLIETAGPGLIADALGSVPVPLPSMPLAGIAPSLAGQELRLAPPAEVVTGEPPARITLYGRLAAQ